LKLKYLSAIRESLLSNEVECDEAYVVAGRKGQPEVIKSKETAIFMNYPG
jgi:hypothetical protein